MPIVLNDTVTLQNVFRVSGAATDPTTVALTVTDPSGVAVTYTWANSQISQVSTGIFAIDIVADAVGIWRYVWEGTGTAIDVADGAFTVVVAADRTLYCTIEDLKEELGVSDTGDDSKLTRSISAASRQIEGFTGWPRFWHDANPVAREFYADSPRTLYLLEDEVGDGIATATGLIVKVDSDGDGTFEQTLTIGTDFLLLPRNAAQRTPAWPYTELAAALPSSSYYWPCGIGRPSVQITAKWGWPTVPDDVMKACLIQAAELFKAKDTAFGVAGINSEFGVMRVRPSLHPTAVALLAPYRKPAVG